MRILHIAPNLLGGGVQNFLLSLLPEQVKIGNEVTLVVIDKYSRDYCGVLEARLRDRGVEVCCLGKMVGDKMSLVKTLIKARRYVSSYKPDIINTHTPLPDIYGSFVSCLTNFTHVITIHNGPERWGQLNKALNGKTPLIFCSQSAYELRLQTNKDIEAIDNGVSTEIVKTSDRVDLRKELGLDENSKIVVSVGSLRPQKNYELLKGIVDEVKDPTIHFCICGGNYGDGYIDVSLFDDYKGNIHFMGLRSDVSAIENAADLFLSCSTFEGLPIAVLEAYFNGIPCVLSPIPQHEKIAQGVDSVYIPKSFDAKDFASAIHHALANKATHAEIYGKRKQSIDVFSISETAKRYQDFYKRHLRQK